METAPLSPIFQSPGPFATVLVDVSHDSENAEHEHELRVRTACDALTEQGADPGVVQTVRERLMEPVHRPAPVGRMLVVAGDKALLDEAVAVRVDQPVASYGPLPDLASWIQHRDSVLTFVLAVVDHVGGDVAIFDSGVPEPADETTAGGETQHVHKVPVGGWSALRYQHVTENVWKQNARDVADEILARVAEGIDLVLLAGDPQSRSLVLEAIEGSSATIVELESGSRAEDGGDEAMQQAVREALLDQVVRRRLALSRELKDRLGREYAVATGVRDVADAFVRGQVETLLIDPQDAAELTLDPADHTGLELGAGAPSGPVPATQALVAAAALTDAPVSVAPSSILGGAPVAALLRWDQDSTGSAG